jgi:alkylated DNA repair dioxygenase AlkB
MSIPGLLYVENFINEAEESYGYKYNYKARSIDREKDYLGPFPDFGGKVARRLVRKGYFETLPEQLIVNEYLPGQGISAYIDQPVIFGEKVASLSLGSNTVMIFC